MDPCIWTGMYTELDLGAAVRELHGQGWEHFEVSHEHLQQLETSEDTAVAIDDALKVVKELGVRLPQAHAFLTADVAVADQDKRREYLRRIKCHCSLAARLEVKCVVIHPGRDTGSSTRAGKREIFQRNCESFAELGDCAGELGMMLCLENLMDHAGQAGKRTYGTASEELLDLLDHLHHPALALTLDTSHANVQNLDIPAVIREWGTSLRALHISDNDGSGDQHRTPGIARNGINWAPVISALREINYAGPFNLEIPGERHEDLEMRRTKARFALEVARMLLE